MIDKEVDKALVARLQAGDLSACAECVSLHADGLYRLAIRLVEDEAEAEDVLQEAFLSAFKAIDSFDGRSTLGTWLHRITYNAALMRLRKRRPEMISVDEPHLTPDGGEMPRQFFDWCCLPEAELETDEARAELARAIRELPEKLKAVFILRELEGQSTSETAEILNITVEAVKVRLHRARLWLRERLSEYFSERVEQSGKAGSYAA
jgi:RNA polymerase sigma-70 factor (ECF subfamily)